jgi:hypothetical protein
MKPPKPPLIKQLPKPQPPPTRKKLQKLLRKLLTVRKVRKSSKKNPCDSLQVIV